MLTCLRTTFVLEHLKDDMDLAILLTFSTVGTETVQNPPEAIIMEPLSPCHVKVQ